MRTALKRSFTEQQQLQETFKIVINDNILRIQTDKASQGNLKERGSAEEGCIYM